MDDLLILLFFCFFLDPPVIREAPQNMSVKAGGIAAFRCIASGDPIPHITWRKNGNKIPSLSSSSRYCHKLMLYDLYKT